MLDLVRRVVNALPASRTVTAVLTVASAGIGLAIAADPATLHDEGLLTLGFARGLIADPVAVGLLLKTKPVLALLYAPFTHGVDLFLAAHAVIAALAVPLVAATARAWSIRAPNLAAFALAASPLGLWSGGTGLSNSDGVTALALFLWLRHARRANVVAGLWLGAMTLLRFELALFAVVVFVGELWTREGRRTALFAPLVPLAYVVVGAVYAHDALWVLHHPPNITMPMPGNATQLVPFAQHDAGSLGQALAAVVPLVCVAALARPSAWSGAERTLAVFAALYLTIFAVTHTAVRPIGPLFVLGYSTRYLLVVTPVVALLAARAADDLGGSHGAGALRLVVLALLVVAAHVVHRASGSAVVPVVVALVALAVAAWRARRGALAAALVVAVPLAAGVLSVPYLVREGYAPDARLPRAVRLVRAHAVPGAVVVTDLQLLDAYAARSGALPGVHVRTLVAADHVYELETLALPGQSQRALTAFSRGLYADPVSPQEVARGHFDARTLFLLDDDPRLALTLPEERWRPALHELAHDGALRLFTLEATP